MPIIRDMLKTAEGRLRLCDIRGVVLASGIMVEAGELSSCLSKLVRTNRVDRQLVPGKGMGRREVWGYRWIA